MTITYLEFHALFLLPPLAALAALTTTRRVDGWGPTLRLGVPLLVAVALLYTAPWDNYLVARGVWRYGEGAVAATVWRAPVEEYLFIAAQPVLTALWLSRLAPPDGREVSVSARDRWLGAAAGAGVGAVGLALLATTATFYLATILLWAAPVLALQWGFGWPYLWRARRTVALGVAVPTAYLCLADAVALSAGVWTLSARYTTGLTVAGLPVEEATFFLVTNAFVVQGLVLLRWVQRR